jgi:hypothetical protein
MIEGRTHAPRQPAGRAYALGWVADPMPSCCSVTIDLVPGTVREQEARRLDETSLSRENHVLPCLFVLKKCHFKIFRTDY